MTSHTPVILLTLDTIRSDRFTSECFPESLPILSEDFTTFSNAYSHGNATPLAFPGITTGQPVVGNGEFADDATTLAELFDRQATGFANNGHLTADRGYDRGFDAFHDQRAPDQSPSLKERARSLPWIENSAIVAKAYHAAKNFTAARSDSGDSVLSQPSWTADKVSDFARRRILDGDEFVWAHYMDAHKPFIPALAVDGPEIDRSSAEIQEMNSYDHEEDPLENDDMAFLEDLYNANIRYLDREIAGLLRDVRDTDWYDDAMIIVVADHGELFGEHGYMFHPMHIDPFDELLQVPLLVKYPDGEHAGESFDHLVQHADISATIAATRNGAKSTPDGTYPLTDDTSRNVISKSNTALRVTTDSGWMVRRRDGTTDVHGQVSDDARDKLEAASFPRVLTTSGVVKGVEEMERQRRLQELGYR